MNDNDLIDLRQELKEAIEFYNNLLPSARTPSLTRVYRVVKLAYDLLKEE